MDLCAGVTRLITNATSPIASITQVFEARSAMFVRTPNLAALVPRRRVNNSSMKRLAV